MPSARCAKGGLGVYSDFVETAVGNPTKVSGLAQGRVTAAFRAFATPLSKQSDFTAALAESRALVDGISDKLLRQHGGPGARLAPRSVLLQKTGGMLTDRGGTSNW